ncbi:hypothetical protein L7F22_025356 [Adiantum nelumboides]|nr:hypothetical protein [Adiantum nelumboides]
MMQRPSGSAKKSPFNKENREAPMEKKRKIGRDIFGVRVMSEPRVQVRQAFSTINLRQESAQNSERDPSSTPSHLLPRVCDDGTPVSMTKDDVEALLNMKMKGKNKFDFKGKSEQMMDYIRKLRTCIRSLQEAEAAHILQKSQLHNQLLEERKENNHKEELLKAKHAEIEQDMAELKSMCATLEDKLHQLEDQKEVLLSNHNQDMENLQKAHKEIGRLVELSDTYQKDLESENQQVASLQDINKRLQEYNTSLQMYNSKLQTDAAASAEAMSKIQKEKSVMMETLSSLRGNYVALQEQLNQAKVSIQEGATQRKLLTDEEEKLRAELQHALESMKQQAEQLEMLAADNARYKECTGKSAKDLEMLSKKATRLKVNYASRADEIESLRSQLEAANLQLQVSENKLFQHKSEGVEKNLTIEDLQHKLADSELRVHEGELLRKKLHNTILELKGNIRVFCRVRPLLPGDEGYDTEEPAVLQYPNSTELLGRGIELVQAQGQKHAFTFDKVFGPEVRQEDVFVEISQLIQSALDGYKVCIFAYGQTGSGKTHTMLGNPDDAHQRGVIPRSLEQIFKASQSLRFQGWSFQMQASMLEIYNETIRDLLAPSTKVDMTAKQYLVKHDNNGNTSVSDLTLIEVTTWKEVSSLLHRASQSRAVGKTAMNEQSSRSHCVFTLRISGLNESTDQEVHGVLNLIDLAGSERLSRSGSSGDRLKETQAINKSLASLGDVILAIANREQHIPYRNSKLTYLLQPCLGGDSKTLMFVNISPEAKSVSESLCSLRFAAKVNACEIGVPRRNTQIRLAHC